MSDWIATYQTDPATGRTRTRLTFPSAANQQPAASTGAADPWAEFPDTPPTQAAPKQEDWSAFPDKPPGEKPQREVGTGEAIASGVKEGLSFGLAPAMAGVAEASGVPNTLPPEEGEDPIRFFKGAARMIANKFADRKLSDLITGDQVTEAYNRGREAALQDQQLAQEQHPYAYVGGQIAGTLALPVGAIGGATRAATAVPRIARTAGAGGVLGGLYGAGGAVSEGQDAAGVATGAAQGAGAGALFGGAGGLGAEAGGKLGSRVASLFRGAVGDESARTEAARKIVAATLADHAAADAAGRPIRIDPAAITEAQIAGTPRALVDAGGERLRALFRSAANVSPEARQAAEDFVQRRYQQQSARVGPYVRDLAGGMAAGNDVEAIKTAARAVNKPLYDRAYAIGDRPIYSQKLDQLMSSEALPKAMSGAVQRGSNRAALDGYGAFNPKVQVTPDGKVLFQRGAQGTPAYPNLQFWDYTQRELRDMATAAERAGRSEEAATLKGLHRELLNELDKQIPAFGDARGVASRFFGAADAWDAGSEFVRRNVDFRESARLLAKMQAPERELFARGFATRLADEIEKSADRSNVLDSIFLNSPAARRKIQMALGPQRADQLEALLRAESLIDKSRKALGNSTTARQLHELGMSAGHGAAGAGAVGALEFLREEHVDPAHVITAALLFGAAKKGAYVIDNRVARHVGELLVSRDPQELQRGLAIVTRNPTLFNALRNATAAGAQVGARDIGTRKAAAAGVALLESGLGGESGGHGHGHGVDALSDQLGQ